MQKKWHVINCLQDRLEDTMNSIHEVSDLPPMIVHGKPQMFDPTFNIIYYGEKQTESRIASAIANVSRPVTTPNLSVNEEAIGAVSKKKRGRPKGSKNGKNDSPKLTKGEAISNVKEKEKSRDTTKEEVVVEED